MGSYTHRRQFLLFLVAVIIPSVLLVSVSLRIIGQEKELAEKRRSEERQHEIEQVRQKLFINLERIRHADHDPAIAFVASAEGNRLVFPWERNTAADHFRKVAAEAEYAKKIQDGEREELIDRRYDRAFELYTESVKYVKHPAQKAYAEILIARALVKSGRNRDAGLRYREVLSSPFDLTDDHGIPFALYAAERLMELKMDQAAVLQRIETEIGSTRWFGPAESYMLRTISEGSASPSSDRLKQNLAAHIRLLEQALALQGDFEKLVLAYSGGREIREGESMWFSYGEQPWLVGVTIPITNAPSPVVVVKADEVLHATDPRVQLARTVGAVSDRPGGQRPPLQLAGELLGEAFPGVKILLNANGDVADTSRNLQQTFYFISLALVLSITLFGAYLFWRDVRRDMRLAELRSQFVSSVTHELKTPLTAIRAFAETLQLRHNTDDQTREEYLETIVNESERLTRLLNNVLDFSKIERGQKMYSLESTSLATVVHAAGRAIHYPLAQQGFDLHVEVDNDIPPVRVDRDALEQAILNLLTNAMKYSGESRRIELRLKSRSGVAVIEVADHGIGIEAKEQERIFEKFYRVPTEENKLIPGTGLGLALVAHIVKAHGGTIAVSSVPSQGSTFSIHLPIGVAA